MQLADALMSVARFFFFCLFFLFYLVFAAVLCCEMEAWILFDHHQHPSQRGLKTQYFFAAPSDSFRWKQRWKKAILVLLSQTLAQGESACFTTLLFFLLLLNNRGRLKGMFSFFTFLSIFFPSLCRFLSGSASFCPSLKFLKISSAQVSALVQEQPIMTQLRPGQVFCIKSWHLALVRHSSIWGNASPLAHSPPPPHLPPLSHHLPV